MDRLSGIRRPGRTIAIDPSIPEVNTETLPTFRANLDMRERSHLTNSVLEQQTGHYPGTCLYLANPVNTSRLNRINLLKG